MMLLQPNLHWVSAVPDEQDYATGTKKKQTSTNFFYLRICESLVQVRKMHHPTGNRKEQEILAKGRVTATE